MRSEPTGAQDVAAPTERSSRHHDARDDAPDHEDRTGRARIRDAAITRFAGDGVANTSVRAIAGEADVSPGLVIHHFGSKAGLRSACDRHVARLVRERKHAAMAAGPGLDPLAALRDADHGLPLLAYLARTLVDGSPQVAALLDELVEDAVDYLAAGVESGLVRPSDHPRERAAITVIWSIGALVLHDHLERLIGVDLTAAPAEIAAHSGYMNAVLDLYGNGLLDADTAARMRDRLAAAAGTPLTDPEEVRT